jgi:hypothetical protein
MINISQKSGNIRYTVVNQVLKWQHNWQQSGNTRYIVVYQKFTRQDVLSRASESSSSSVLGIGFAPL